MADSTATNAPYTPGYELGARQILRYMSDQRLKPGDRMPTEYGLAESLRLSRTVVREAVKLLSALGRLEVHKGKGIFVADDANLLARTPFALFAPDDVSQVATLFEYRAVLEGSAAEIASRRATPQDRNAMNAHAQQTSELAAAGDREGFGRADYQFHLAVANATGNSFLASSVATVHQVQRHVVTLGRDANPIEAMIGSAEQHLAIAEAIGTGQTDRARELMLNHVNQSKEASERAIQRRVFGDASTPTEQTAGT